MKPLLHFAALFSTLFVATLQAAQDSAPLPRYSQMTHGGIGLIQMPTARMAADGDFSFQYADNEEYRFWSASIQLFPWLESTIRYTDVRTRLYSNDPGFSGDQTLKDKGIDLKLKLLNESYYLPQLALGIRDFGGTGFFESEYLTASKRLGPIDVHFGLGWGYLGRSGNIDNPFCELKDSFCQRSAGFAGTGGSVNFDKFFKGPAALFGGIEYQTPWPALRLKAEYDGNDYQTDRAGRLVQDSRWNFGAVYRAADYFDLSLSYQRGNTLGFAVSYNYGFNSAVPDKIDTPPVAVPEFVAVNANDIALPQLAGVLLREGGFYVRKLALQDNKVIISGVQLRYRDHDEGMERVGRVLAANLPEQITQYEVTHETARLPMLTVQIDAAEFKQAARYQSLQNDVRSSYVNRNPDMTAPSWDYQANSRFWTPWVELLWSQSWGNPEAFYLYQAAALWGNDFRLNDNLTLRGVVKTNLISNYDKFNFKVDSQAAFLPRVRTFVREYVTNSDVQLDSLTLTWSDRLSENVYAQAYGGYLEMMYGGVGGEFLYAPLDSNIAIGADVNYVKQRSFEDRVSFRDYDTVTGHINVYWQPEFIDNTLLSFNIGRFLAQDYGVNFGIARRFDSGIVVGAFAAKTNVSSREFGEGSFNKGFYISLPLDLFSVKPATGRGLIPWVPLTRDGGQMLTRPAELYQRVQKRARFYD
ncbi:YjbH domain-containing protein [Rheinheimera fenheensis]|uniref:YjbH domain-containing protein n=1 Tax=Rheinheimera fenheensis TaxID=3152295 RepID=UPI003260E793